jgi:hypothetical protein
MIRPFRNFTRDLRPELVVIVRAAAEAQGINPVTKANVTVGKLGQYAGRTKATRYMLDLTVA